MIGRYKEYTILSIKKAGRTASTMRIVDPEDPVEFCNAEGVAELVIKDGKITGVSNIAKSEIPKWMK